MADRLLLRRWVVEAAYPGKKPFLFGTIEADNENAVHRAYEDAWGRISPHPIALIVRALPGMIVFHSDETPHG